MSHCLSSCVLISINSYEICFYFLEEELEFLICKAKQKKVQLEAAKDNVKY